MINLIFTYKSSNINYKKFFLHHFHCHWSYAVITSIFLAHISFLSSLGLSTLTYNCKTLLASHHSCHGIASRA